MAAVEEHLVAQVQAFISQNGLDDRAARSLLRANPKVQEHVLARGEFHDCSNVSAACMQRIRECSQQFGQALDAGAASVLAEAVEEFIRDNAIDERAANALRHKDAKIQESVLRRGNMTDCQNPSAACMHRIQQAQEEIRNLSAGMPTVPPAVTGSMEISEFIRENMIDDRAARVLRKKDPWIQHHVMSRGSLAESRNPSASCMMRIQDAQEELKLIHQAQGAPVQQMQKGVPPPAKRSWAAVNPARLAGDVPLIVSGCQTPGIAAALRGRYHLVTENHGRPVYRRDEQVDGKDIQMYYWDERDGPDVCGWWFGLEVGSDKIYAYHPSRDMVPPTVGWRAPWDGVVDGTLQISAAMEPQKRPRLDGLLVVTGCQNAGIAVALRGNYYLVADDSGRHAENHGRPVYRKDEPVQNSMFEIYFWDERDGNPFCGWWFGMQVGSDKVYAYHPSKGFTPPRSGWRAPFDSAADGTIQVASPSNGKAMDHGRGQHIPPGTPAAGYIVNSVQVAIPTPPVSKEDPPSVVQPVPPSNGGEVPVPGTDKPFSISDPFGLQGAGVHTEGAENVDEPEQDLMEVDDPYKTSAGQKLGPDNCFESLGSIREGEFSRVVKCKNAKDGKEYIVKVASSDAMKRTQTEKEKEIYKKIADFRERTSNEGTKHLMKLVAPETFEHCGNLCLVFELQKCDLREGMKRYGQGEGKGLQLRAVQLYGRQIFLALRVLRKLKIVHCDLSPDNLLLSNDKNILITDFGSSIEVGSQALPPSWAESGQCHSYHAPEIILGNKKLDPQADIWSAGVTLFELATGQVLFNGETTNAVLRQMLESCGAFRQDLATSGEHSSMYFDSASGDFMLQDADSGREKLVPMATWAMPPKPVRGLLSTALKEPPKGGDWGRHSARVAGLAELVGKCVNPDPKGRIIPDQALIHPVLKVAEAESKVGG